MGQEQVVDKALEGWDQYKKRNIHWDRVNLVKCIKMKAGTIKMTIAISNKTDQIVKWLHYQSRIRKDLTQLLITQTMMEDRLVRLIHPDL